MYNKWATARRSFEPGQDGNIAALRFILTVRWFLFTFMNDLDYIKLAYKEALKAYKNNEVPVGAIIVSSEGKILARAYNKKEKNKDISAHAEILALKKAMKKVGSTNLSNSTIYVTLEPCLMCSSAIIDSKIKKIIYGVKRTNSELTLSYLSDYLFENGYEVKYGYYENKINELLQTFFKKMR